MATSCSVIVDNLIASQSGKTKELTDIFLKILGIICLKVFNGTLELNLLRRSMMFLGVGVRIRTQTEARARAQARI